EEPVQSGIMAHINGRVDMNQRSYARDQQHELRAQRIEQQSPFAARKPCPAADLKTVARQHEGLPGADCRDQKTESNKSAANDAWNARWLVGVVVNGAPEEQHQGCSQQR